MGLAGEVLLDGHNVKSLELKWLRSQIGLVNQEPALFATSIKENILYGKDNGTNADIEDACKAANAHAFIVQLPDRYDTQVIFPHALKPRDDGVGPLDKSQLSSIINMN